MNTPKIILYKHKTYTDGTHPIIIQVVKNSKATRKVLGRCLPNDWLESKKRVSSRDINSTRINEAIVKALKTYGVTKIYSFQDLMQRQINIFDSNQQVSRKIINEGVLKQITQFKHNVDFEDFDEEFVFKFCEFLRVRHENNPNSIREKMQVIGKIMRIAMKEKIILENPMSGMTFPKQKVIKTKLSTTEMLRWINSDFTGVLAEVRDFLTAMIYLRGIRVGDAILLHEKNIVDGRIIYRELKTGEIHDIKIRPELQVLIDRYSGKSEYGYLFPFMELPLKLHSDKFLLKEYISKARSKITRYVKIIAKKLEIEKNVSPHTIRHSFSRLANSVIKNTTITKNLVGHKTLEVHEGYISDISDNDELDIHADTVLNVLNSQ